MSRQPAASDAASTMPSTTPSATSTVTVSPVLERDSPPFGRRVRGGIGERAPFVVSQTPFVELSDP